MTLVTLRFTTIGKNEAALWSVREFELKSLDTSRRRVQPQTQHVRLSNYSASEIERKRNRRRGVLITAIMFEALGEHNPLLSDDRHYLNILMEPSSISGMRALGSLKLIMQADAQ